MFTPSNCAIIHFGELRESSRHVVINKWQQSVSVNVEKHGRCLCVANTIIICYMYVSVFIVVVVFGYGGSLMRQLWPTACMTGNFINGQWPAFLLTTWRPAINIDRIFSFTEKTQKKNRKKIQKQKITTIYWIFYIYIQKNIYIKLFIRRQLAIILSYPSSSVWHMKKIHSIHL